MGRPTILNDTGLNSFSSAATCIDRLHRRILELEALLAKVSRSARSTSDGSMTLPGPEAISRQTADNGRPHFELEAGADNETLRLKVQVSMTSLRRRAVHLNRVMCSGGYCGCGDAIPDRKTFDAEGLDGSRSTCDEAGRQPGRNRFCRKWLRRTAARAELGESNAAPGMSAHLRRIGHT